MSTNEAKREVSTVAIPLLADPPMIIEAPFPLTEREWEYMMNVLRTMRPGLVQFDGIMGFDDLTELGKSVVAAEVPGE